MAAPRPIRRASSGARGEEQLRLMTKVARLYHEHGVRQPEIARRLHISQARVSRLLKQAEADGIVRTTVIVPDGVQTALEEQLEAHYGLREAVVIELLDETDAGIARDLGTATARYLEASLTGGDVVGISSWSATLLAAVDAMRPLPKAGAERAVQLFGGVGNPAAEAHAARLTQRFADLTGARPTFMLAPGIAHSVQSREALTTDRFVRAALDELDEVTLALVGIGALEPSSLLQSSGNIFSEAELAGARRARRGGRHLPALLRRGRPAGRVGRRSPGHRRDAEQLADADRSVGIAGGERKYEAIRGALRGGWINVLITDHATAERLLAEPR